MDSRLLWLAALIVGIIGVIMVLKGSIIFGILVIVIACLIGPGGVSIFNKKK